MQFENKSEQSKKCFEIAVGIHLKLDKSIESAFWDFFVICNNSGNYSNWSLADMGRLFVPPILEKNFFIFYGSGDGCELRPMAFCTWAWITSELSEQLAQRHIDPLPHQWNSGDHLWLIDMVVMNRDATPIARYIHKRLSAEARLRGTTNAYAIRRDAAGKVKKIAVWPINRPTQAKAS